MYNLNLGNIIINLISSTILNTSFIHTYLYVLIVCVLSSTE